MATDTASTILVPGFPFRLDTQILAQFCGARTEPYTAHVSYVVCKDLKISIKGQRSVNNALNNLAVYKTPDERLTFGWAEENLIRASFVHMGAYEHLGVMVTLSEAFHESYAARVMFELAQMKADHGDITPHFRQWKNVIHAVNGIFATTDFGIVLEDYIRLDPFSVNTGMNVSTSHIPIPAKVVAEALVTLGKVLTGEEKQLTITGSAMIAWLAAVADWLYDLRIAVFSSNGEHLQSTDPSQDTQVLFVFQQELGCHVSNEPWTHDKARASQDKRSISDTMNYSASVHNTPFTGRVVWQSLLPRVFGHSFHHLDHEDSRPFATMLGSAARMFQSLVDESVPDSTSLVSDSEKANTASYGPGLLQTLTNWLPELRRFQGRMERQLKLSSSDAAQAYRDSLTALRKICDCGICRPLPMNPEPASPGPDSDLPDIESLTLLHPSKAPSPPPKSGYCLPTLVETIIALALTLSRTIVSSNLYPSRAGIQSLYHSQSLRRLAARGLYWTQHFKLVYGNEWNAPDHRRLINTVQLFSGSKPTRYLAENLMAVSHEGVCAYFTDLEKVGLGRREVRKGEGVRLIRVVSGGINVRYKVFSRLCIGEVVEEEWDDPWEKVKIEHLDQMVCCL